MDSHIVLTKIQIVDVFFRFCAVGILMTYFAQTLIQQRDNGWRSVAWLIVCFIGYILLTAPIENHHYGILRPIFLWLTDLTAYALLAVYWHRVYRRSLFLSMPLWAKAAFSLWVSYMGYFFLAEQGRGVFHDALHVIGLILLLFILFDAVRGFNDDLNENRRDLRKLVVFSISGYMTLLTLIELMSQTLKDNWLFSLGNAFSMLVFAAVAVWYKLFSSQKLDPQPNQVVQSSQNLIESEGTAPVHSDNTKGVSLQAQSLKDAMAQGLYLQNELTIKSLASTLSMPEHQLRKVINQELGFDNFSHFLNSYRIPHVAEQMLEESHLTTPVLTLALEAGYNSIAPFNRAFKEVHKMTPTEFRANNRRSFQK